MAIVLLSMVGCSKNGLPTWMSAATCSYFDNISRPSSAGDSDGASTGGSPDSGLGLGERALSTAGAVFISAIIVNPLDVAKDDDGRSSGGASPESTGSVETSISSHFGGMNYPSLFSSRPSGYGVSQQSDQRLSGSGSRFGSMDSPISPAREEPPSYLQRYESFDNPIAGRGAQTSGSHDDDDKSSSNPQFGRALYDFTAGGDDELSLVAGEEIEIDYEVDGWFYVKKKCPGRDGKKAGLVPVLYVRVMMKYINGRSNR